MKSATITLALFTTLALPGAAAAGDDLFDLPRVRAGLASAPGPAQVTPTALRLVKTTRLDRARARETNDADSVWDGLLIGAGAGFAGGLVWGPPARRRLRGRRWREIGKQHGQYESPKRGRPIDALREETDRQMADKHGRPPGGVRLSFPG